MNKETVVGIDWGTSNRRAYVLDAQGELLRHHSDACGILAVGGDFETSLRELLQKLEVQHADVVMSGMVGSRNGWHEAPYLFPAQAISRLHEALMEIDSTLPHVRCRIVPGYRFSDSHGIPDVMRGEETQILGALALGASDGWFLLPGTHCKWVQVDNGKIAEIVTFMTGELFALLSEHGTLAGLVRGGQASPAAFTAGLQAARHDGFTHAAFGCRALVVTDAMPAAHAASYLSGLLIGAEIADIRIKAGRHALGTVQIIGSPALAARYAGALEFFDIQACVWQPDAVYIAALRRLAAARGGD